VTDRDLLADYRRVRGATEALCEPLETEDYVVQSMADVSPTKWHLAHTTWFFETFLLRPHLAGYTPVHPRYEFLFNSYYNAVGPQFSRPRRGLLSRPTVGEIYAYRRHVDAQMEELLTAETPPADASLPELLRVGLNHEQQHQELLLTDIKHVLSVNPLQPAYREPANDEDADATVTDAAAAPLRWLDQPGGLVEIGRDADGAAADAFAYDNETPQHRVWLEPFALASRPVTCGEYLAFMADGGYERPELWLSEGWDAVRSRGWRAPLYWEERDGRWFVFTLTGARPVRAAEPVCHVSHFEADAYARWAGARLPGEGEWEIVAAAHGGAPTTGTFVEDGRWHPCPAPSPATEAPDTPVQLLGDVWEWTRSPYVAYPGYRTPPGALGEYNAKFMSSQLVLRGGSCATPRDHVRATYRNFFPPDARWQFSGFRLAKDVDA
jgi:ergothioneine biosynthesis protein EgtB